MRQLVRTLLLISITTLLGCGIEPPAASTAEAAEPGATSPAPRSESAPPTEPASLIRNSVQQCIATPCSSNADCENAPVCIRTGQAVACGEVYPDFQHFHCFIE